MCSKTAIVVLFLIVFPATIIRAGPRQVDFRGQWSGWSSMHLAQDLPLRLGSRYIPQLNYEFSLGNRGMIDFELSPNVYGNIGAHLFDSLDTNADIRAYRLWMRYSTRQFECRIGLQKINFGSATLLRPLMWFDRTDARDPLGLTDGLWAMLCRYYFLNNSNIWLWGLYGNSDPKGFEQIGTYKNHPEFGGRIQYPLPGGEAAITYHYRTADGRKGPLSTPAVHRIPEHRVGVDTRLDFIVGCWFEASWTACEKDIGALTHQQMFNSGLDYTFNIGNGLYMVYEQLYFSYDRNAFTFDNTASFSVVSMSYPFGFFDTFRSIHYYSWADDQIYTIFNWQRQLDRLTFYILGFWNPEEGRLPSRGDTENLYAGKGVQLMFVFNH